MFDEGAQIQLVASTRRKKAGPRRGSLGFVSEINCSGDIHDIRYYLVTVMFHRFGFEKKTRAEKQRVVMALPFLGNKKVTLKKMVNQITIAGTMIGVCECLIYGHKAGLDLETVLKSIGGGAAACWTLDVLAPKIVYGDFEPGFMVEHFVKDLGIALQEAEQMKLSLPGLALAKQLYLSLIAVGKGTKGTQALYLALEKMSGMD